MKNILLALIVALVVISTSEATLTEDFEDAYDATQFLLTNSDTDSSFGVSGGKLAFHGWEYSEGNTGQRGGVFTTKNKFYGDFVATADLSGFNAPLEGGGKFVLAAIHVFGDNGEIARVGRCKGYSANIDNVEVKINTKYATLASNPSSGAMKLERIGTIMNAYWDDTLVFSSPFGNTPVSIGVFANRWGTVSYFDVAFDNFEIIPEPVTFLLLSVGVMMVRRKR